MDTNAEKEILEYKRKLFLEYVGKSAIILKVKTPKVKFWSHYEDHFPEEIAHIHIRENLICISDIQLKSMNEDDIKETATHEVTHLIEEEHGFQFEDLRRDVETKTWSPPSGVFNIIDAHNKIKKSKQRKLKPLKYKCNDCEKRCKTIKCKYCNRYFCDEHITPRKAGFHKKGLIDETNTHPCFGYHKYLEEVKKKEDKDYDRNLDNICECDSAQNFDNSLYYNYNHNLVVYITHFFKKMKIPLILFTIYAIFNGYMKATSHPYHKLSLTLFL